MDLICYLCGNELGIEKPSGDHRLPTLLLDRKQPIVRGFDYGGKAPTHENCNNRFKSEVYGRKALDLLRVLYDPKCAKRVFSQSEPQVLVYALNSSCLKSFTSKELEFFKITDVRGRGGDVMRDLSTLLGDTSANPLAIPINISLSVLAKSGAALLVDRHLSEVPKRWKIFALPHVGNLKHEELESVFPDREPFDKEVGVWIKPISSEDYLLAFLAHRVFVIFVFQFFSFPNLITLVRNRFPNSDCALFEGSSLMELVNYVWRKV